MKINMKKVVSLVLAILMIASCTACTSKNPGTNIDTTQAQTEETGNSISSENTEIDKSDFLRAPNEGNEIGAYRAEVSKRLKAMDGNEDVKFSTPEEIQFLENNGYDMTYRGLEMALYSSTYMELEIYTYPIVYVGDNGSIQVWSILESGDIYVKAIEGKLDNHFSSDYIGDAHCPKETETVRIIRSEKGFAVVHDEANDKIAFWSLGEKICEHEVPANSVYCGFSDWVGYIFRAGTDVYALVDFGTIQSNGKENCEIKPIAHNVQLVIDADYYMGSDDWAQPLFLMTDGTVKGYCEWMGTKGAPSDDPSYLYEIRYEGGYDK